MFNNISPYSPYAFIWFAFDQYFWKRIESTLSGTTVRFFPRKSTFIFNHWQCNIIRTKFSFLIILQLASLHVSEHCVCFGCHLEMSALRKPPWTGSEGGRGSSGIGNLGKLIVLASMWYKAILMSIARRPKPSASLFHSTGYCWCVLGDMYVVDMAYINRPLLRGWLLPCYPTLSCYCSRSIKDIASLLSHILGMSTDHSHPTLFETFKSNFTKAWYVSR